MYKRICFIFCFVLIFIFSFTVTSFAASTVQVPYAEPPTSDTQGYITVKRANGYIDTFYWTVTPIGSDSPSSSTVSITINSDGLVFTMGGTSGVTYRATLLQLNTSSSVFIRYTGSFTSVETVNYSVAASSIIEFSARGNFGNIINNIGSNANLSVQFEKSSDSELSDLATILNRQYDTLSSIKTLLGYIEDYQVQDSSGRLYNAIFVELLNNQNTTLNDMKTLLNYLKGYEVDSDGYIYNSLFKKYMLEMLDLLESLQDYEVDNSGYVYNNLFKQYFLQIIDILEQFRDTQLDESTDPLPSDDLNDYEDSNSSLRNDSDVSTDLDYVFGGFNGNDSGFSPFRNGFSVIWDLVDSLLSTNPVLFSLVTLVLSIGLLSLIFNRR